MENNINGVSTIDVHKKITRLEWENNLQQLTGSSND